jgi:hypothetical protein
MVSVYILAIYMRYLVYLAQETKKILSVLAIISLCFNMIYVCELGW